MAKAKTTKATKAPKAKKAAKPGKAPGPRPAAKINLKKSDLTKAFKAPKAKAPKMGGVGKVAGTTLGKAVASHNAARKRSASASKAANVGVAARADKKAKGTPGAAAARAKLVGAGSTPGKAASRLKGNVSVGVKRGVTGSRSVMRMAAPGSKPKVGKSIRGPSHYVSRASNASVSGAG